MVLNESSGGVDEVEAEPVAEAEGSVFVKIESSGTWWTILGPGAYVRIAGQLISGIVACPLECRTCCRRWL